MREVIGSMSDWSGVLKDVFRQVEDSSLTLEHFKAFSEHRNPFATAAIPADHSVILADWQAFYLAEFGIALDIASIRVPEHRKDFDRLIVVVAGLKIQQVYEKCAEHFTCWKYTNDNLDEAVPTNDRTPTNGSYAVWVRNRVEADEELKNLSVNDLKQRGTAGITLLERLLMELKCFRETGKHLDIKNITLCAGSRYTDGVVPYVVWLPVLRRLKVYFCHPGSTDDYLRSREVVP